MLLRGREHERIRVPEDAGAVRSVIAFGGQPDRECLLLREESQGRYLLPSYYVGADWLRTGQVAVSVEPKLNGADNGVDHVWMLFNCLQRPELARFAGRLYTLDTEAPFIGLPRRNDLLTPLLVGHFLYLLQEVVRQGLKKGYNPVNRELRGRIKGKLDIGQTLRRGTFRQRPLAMSCAYSEFSTDVPENRLLKQALRFARHYLNDFPTYARSLEHLIRFCEPAFEAVSDAEVTLKVAPVSNPLYRAYGEALRVGWLLLKRFGFSLRTMESEQGDTVHVPPHWIDMSYLFELYVLGLLYDRFGTKAVLYGEEQAKGNYGLPDFLLPGAEPWIIDAKYKPLYQQAQYRIEDVRQLSGYARDRQVLTKLGVPAETLETTVVRCLVVYPDRLDDEYTQQPDQQAVPSIPELASLQDRPLPAFIRFYKLAVKLPAYGSVKQP
ncbi:McrC family protein [Hymenobacter pini]|uniref:McrC family protein n=1 Tax=Hymenobacter pini TaxID=2880879 RepID=UPI001CF30A23|nr:McrC family protein [Hymenobacter pini]MCA8831920.1 McrC family protein [Hymenobacter pini]